MYHVCTRGVVSVLCVISVMNANIFVNVLVGDERFQNVYHVCIMCALGGVVSILCVISVMNANIFEIVLIVDKTLQNVYSCIVGIETSRIVVV